MIEQVFEDILNPYGPTWSPGRSIDKYDAQYTDKLLAFIKKAVSSQKRVRGPKGPIFCGLIVNPNFNALATTSRGYELIALFSGAISHVLAGHHCLLSDPESLPFVGDPGKECVSLEAIDLFKRCNPLQHPSHHPKEDRFAVATCLVYLSCVYVALHEVGHLVSCHPAYLKSRYGVNVYEELPMRSSKLPDIDVAIALEWEADEYAAVTSYQLTHALVESGSFGALRPMGVDFAWGLATSMIFLIMARLSRSWTRGSKTHPPAFIRYVWSMMSVERAPECAEWKPDGESLRAGFSEAANWFGRHNIEIGSEEEHLSVPEAMQHLRDQYDQVRDVFARDSDEWDNLHRYRSENSRQ